MFVPDLGEFAYGIGDAVLSKEDAAVAVEGEGIDLPSCCAPEACSRILFSSNRNETANVVNHTSLFNVIQKKISFQSGLEGKPDSLKEKFAHTLHFV